MRINNGVTFGEVVAILKRYAAECEGYTIGDLKEEGGIIVFYRDIYTNKATFCVEYGD